MSEAIAFPETRTNEAEQLADRYHALWNEADPERQRLMTPELYAEDGTQILQPPQEMRAIAASAGIGMAVYRLNDVVKFHWDAFLPDAEVAAVGLVFLVLGADGRIRRDYVFVEG